jgi:predicted NBD/HSP70 family sugar kinase
MASIRENAVTIGVDIGGTKTLAIAVGKDGEILDQVRLASGYGAERVIDGAVEAVTQLRARLGDAVADAPIGIGIPGTVDHVTGEVQQALNLGLEHLALADVLADRFGVPVHVENDVNAAALGAAELPAVTAVGGDGQRESPVDPRLERGASLAYLNLGTGLAAGYVIDGALWRGATGAAGEIGHIPLDPSGPECVCGERGCLEAMASGSGIARQWSSDSPGDEVPSAPELVALADAGDERAIRILERLAWAVASAVRLLVLAQDVERVVIGGGLAEALGDRLIDPVMATLVGWEAGSPFLAALGPSGRAVLAPVGIPLAAIGAALAAQGDPPPDVLPLAGPGPLVEPEPLARPDRLVEPDEPGRVVQESPRG